MRRRVGSRFLSLAACALCLGGCKGEAPAVSRGAVAPLDAEETERLGALGDQTATILAQTLIARLQEQLKQSGAVGAVDFCSLEALPMTARVTAEQGMEVKRTSFRFRNPENAPDSLEAEALRHFEGGAGRMSAEGWLQAVSDTEVRYYKPLFIAELCLQCHGTDAELAPGIPELLRERYPADRATGYATGDFRGLIRVTMPRANAGG